ncbi:MAG: hypothetical protein K2X02_00200 [Alphaproteobacteria bacterium]|nr:hypothetical protein [Alphaproteobacteria bacterium]
MALTIRTLPSIVIANLAKQGAAIHCLIKNGSPRSRRGLVMMNVAYAWLFTI